MDVSGSGREQNKTENFPFDIKGVPAGMQGLAFLMTVPPPVLHTLPDTALLRDGRPFFIPDFASPCIFELAVVLRICRLGKSISPRFAGRYYDAVSLGVTFTALNLFEECRRNGLPWEISKGFDGAAALGRFIPLDDTAVREGLCPELHTDGGRSLTADARTVMADACQYIAYISNFYTLRQGDLVYLVCGTGRAEAARDTRLTGHWGEQELLSFNIK